MPQEPDSKLKVISTDLEDKDLYRLNQVIHDLYSKIDTTRVDGRFSGASQFQNISLKTDRPLNTLTDTSVLNYGELKKLGLAGSNTTTTTIISGGGGGGGGTTSVIAQYPPSISYQNAASRVLGEKVGETISVLDFGAVADGLTDDSPAFVNAISAALAAERGKRILIPACPAGSFYKLDSSVRVNNVELFGVVNAAAGAITWVSGDKFPSYLGTAPYDQITIDGTTYSITTYTDDQHITIGTALTASNKDYSTARQNVPIAFEGEGDLSLVKRGAALASASIGLFDIKGENISFNNFKVDGNVTTPTELRYFTSGTGGFVNPSTGDNDPMAETLTQDTSFWVHGPSKNVTFYKVSVSHTGGYSILVDATDGSNAYDADPYDIWNTRIVDCNFTDNRPHTFGTTLNGFVNVSGTQVDLYSGDAFGNLSPGDTITINGSNFTISTIDAGRTTLHLTSSLSTLSRVTYSALTPKTYGSWTGGIFLNTYGKQDASNYLSTIYNTLVQGCFFRGNYGNCIWSHLYGFDVLFSDLRVLGNTFIDNGLDCIQFGGITGGSAIGNRTRRTGYLPNDHTLDVSTSNPTYPQWLNGTNSVALDTSGICKNVSYANNTFISTNGGDIDADGFCDGTITGNVCFTPRSYDPEYVEDNIAISGPYNNGITWSYGCQPSNSYGLDFGGVNVNITGNSFINKYGGAIRLAASRQAFVSGNNIDHPSSFGNSPISLFNIGTKWNKKTYSTVVSNNTIKFDPSSGSYPNGAPAIKEQQLNLQYKVNTAGTTVTYATTGGLGFDALTAGNIVLIDGTSYTIASVDTPTQITLTTSAGTHSNVAFLAATVWESSDKNWIHMNQVLGNCFEFYKDSTTGSTSGITISSSINNQSGKSDTFISRGRTSSNGVNFDYLEFLYNQGTQTRSGFLADNGLLSVSGYVTTSGFDVTWSTGDKFTLLSAGDTITIGGTSFTIASKTNSKLITLSSSPGTNTTPVPYFLNNGSSAVSGFKHGSPMLGVGNSGGGSVVTGSRFSIGADDSVSTRFFSADGFIAATQSGVSGTVNTSVAGSTYTVAQAGGSDFSTLEAGGTITINNIDYTIAAVASSSSLTITTSAGTQTGVTFYASPVDDQIANKFTNSYGLIKYDPVNHVFKTSNSATNGIRSWSILGSGGSSSPGGSNSSVQYNVGGTTFGGDSDLTYDSSIGLLSVKIIKFPNLTSIPSVVSGSSIIYQYGGRLYVSENGGAPQYLVTSGGSGTPGGASGAVQFNDSSSFGGSSNLFWDKVNSYLSLGGTTSGITSRLYVRGASHVWSDTTSQIVLLTKGTSGQTANLLEAQDNSGNTLLAVNPAGGLYLRTTGSPSGITGAGLIYYDTTANKFKINENNGTTYSLGPAGSNTYVQYNDAGIPGGDSGFTWNKTGKLLTVNGTSGTAGIVANTSYIQSAQGFYTASTSYNAVQAPSGGLAARSTTLLTYLAIASNASVSPSSGDDFTNNAVIYYDQTGGTNLVKLKYGTGVGPSTLADAFGYAGGWYASSSNTDAIQAPVGGVTSKYLVNTGSLTWIESTSPGATLSNQARIYMDSSDHKVKLSQATSTYANIATVAGLDTQVQYNNAGSSGASGNFTWDNTNKRLIVNGIDNTTAIEASNGYIYSDDGFITNSTSLYAIKALNGGVQSSALLLSRAAVVARDYKITIGSTGAFIISDDTVSTDRFIISSSGLISNSNSSVAFDQSGNLTVTNGTIAANGSSGGINVPSNTYINSIQAPSGGFSAVAFSATRYIKVGSNSGTPSLISGDVDESGWMYYDSSSSKLRVKISGSWTDLLTASGTVTSAKGTADQILVNGTSGSAQTGALTLTLPQDIGTSSSPSFSSLTLKNASPNGLYLKDSTGIARQVLTLETTDDVYLDNIYVGDIYIRPKSGNNIVLGRDPAVTSSVLPNGDNNNNLGSSSYGWSSLYARTHYYWNGSSYVAASFGSYLTSAVTSAAAGSGISVSASSGAITITNTGVISATAGSGISVSSSTGSITITNNGVTSLVAGAGVSVSGSTGSITVTNSWGSVNTFATALNQSLTSTSSPSFSKITLANSASNGLAIKDVSGTSQTVLSMVPVSGLLDCLYLDNINKYDIYIRPGNTRYIFMGYGPGVGFSSYVTPNGVVDLGTSTYPWNNVCASAYSVGASTGKSTSFTVGGTTYTFTNGILTGI